MWTAQRAEIDFSPKRASLVISFDARQCVPNLLLYYSGFVVDSLFLELEFVLGAFYPEVMQRTTILIQQINKLTFRGNTL